MLSVVIAKEAIQLVAPSILSSMERGIVKRPVIYIVIAHRRKGTLEDIVHEETLGVEPPDGTMEKYIAIARSKTLISLRTGLPTAEVQQLRSDLLLPGDTKFWGSVVRGSVVVGASAVESFFDEMYSGWTADACVALVKRARKAAGDSNGDFM